MLGGARVRVLDTEHQKGGEGATMMILIHKQILTQVGDDVPECLPVVEQVKKFVCMTIIILLFFLLEMCKCDRRLHHKSAVLPCYQAELLHSEEGQKISIPINYPL